MNLRAGTAQILFFCNGKLYKKSGTNKVNLCTGAKASIADAVTDAFIFGGQVLLLNRNRVLLLRWL